MNSWNEKTVSDTFLEKLCEQMLNHFENTKSICLISWLTDRGIIFQSFLNWTKRHKNLKVAYELVKQKIGCRREKLAIWKKYNTNYGTIISTLRFYHPVWKECFLEAVSLKLKQSEKGTSETKIVIMEKWPEAETDRLK